MENMSLGEQALMEILVEEAITYHVHMQLAYVKLYNEILDVLDP